MVLALEPDQELEMRSLQRKAYSTGAALFGELLRDHNGSVLRLGLVKRTTALKIRKLLLKDAEDAQHPDDAIAS